jgi:hypothetical protein
VNTLRVDYIAKLCDQILAALDSFEKSHPRRSASAFYDARLAVDALRDSTLARTEAILATLSMLERKMLRISDGLASDKDVALLLQLSLSLQNARNALAHGQAINARQASADFNRRTRFATRLALRQLPAADRDRYGEEFLSELADLARADQARYAIRQVFRAREMRQSLTGRSTGRSLRIAVVVGAADTFARLAGMD